MIRFRVELFLDGRWQECKLATLVATLEPGGFGTFATREAAVAFTATWPKQETMRVVEVGK